MQVDQRLVDMQMFAALRHVIGVEEFQTLVRSAINAFGGYGEAMMDNPDDPAAVIANAHKLKGSAGSLGLCGIGAAATAVETALDDGRDGRVLVLELRRIIVETRDQLIALGIVAPSSAPALSHCVDNGKQ